MFETAKVRGEKIDPGEVVYRNPDGTVSKRPKEESSEVLIQPFGCEGSDFPGVVPVKMGPVPCRFIGGPLDGQIVKVPPDGRIYVHKEIRHDRRDPDTGFPVWDEIRYLPSLLSFDRQRKVVYILESHCREERLTVSEKARLDKWHEEYDARVAQGQMGDDHNREVKRIFQKAISQDDQGRSMNLPHDQTILIEG